MLSLERVTRFFRKADFYTINLFVFLFICIFSSNAEGDYISLIERDLTPSEYNSKKILMKDTISFNKNSTSDVFYTHKISPDIIYKDRILHSRILIKNITLNDMPVKYKLKEINEREYLLVLGEKGKYFSTGDNVFKINYTLDYSHYKDVGVIRKFTNKFIQEEGSLPVKKVILKVNAPPMSKIERVDYKNTIDGKDANNYIVEGSLDSVKMQSSSDISNKESMRLNAVIGKVVTTYWGQDISTLFPTLPIDNDYYRICFSLLSIVVLSKFVLMLLESLMQSRRPREYVVAIRNVLVSFSGIVNLFGLREEKEYKCKYK